MKYYNLRLTEKQLDFVLTAMMEWAWVEGQTKTGNHIVKALEKTSDSIYKQMEKQDYPKIKKL